MLLSEIEMLSSQVINHSFDLGVISLTFIGNTSKRELLLRSFKISTVSNKIGSSVIVHCPFSSILAVCSSAHGCESIFIGGSIELRRLANNKIGLC